MKSFGSQHSLFIESAYPQLSPTVGFIVGAAIFVIGLASNIIPGGEGGCGCCCAVPVVIVFGLLEILIPGFGGSSPPHKQSVVHDDYSGPDIHRGASSGSHYVEPHWVSGYDRSDGTHVDGYLRDGDGDTSHFDGDGYYQRNPGSRR
jgi:hypothetical protein